MNSVVFHIGYHKTGSTWLQRVFFEHDGNNLSLIGGERFEARKKIVWPSALEYSPESVREYFRRIVARAAEDGKIPVFSDERFSGNPFSGGFDSKELAERIHRTYPAARILIVVREQKSMIFSSYDEYVREGGACGLRDFLTPKTRYCTPMFRLGHLMYHRLVALYVDIFGEENVRVLPFELLRRDALGFVEEILAFCGGQAKGHPDLVSRVNTSRSPVLLAIQRRLNPFIVRDDLNANSILAIPHGRYYLMPLIERLCRLTPPRVNRSLERRMREEIREVTEGRFAESNTILSELIGVNLADYGYETLGPISRAAGSPSAFGMNEPNS